MKQNFRSTSLLLSTLLLSLLSCTPQLPKESVSLKSVPAIFPDYINVTIPGNIAPLTFEINEDAEEYITRLSGKGGSITLSGRQVIPSMKEWKELLASSLGGEIQVEVYARKSGQWNRYQPFHYDVSADTIDSYLSYRLIPPSYVAYEELTINQRNLTSFEEKVIYDNLLVGGEQNGQCINCHSYKNYKTDHMQFHVRQYNGGTVIVNGDKVTKIDMKTDSTLSGGVYPSFNPVCNVIAYSVNNTGQSFHTRSANKVEVQDMASDLILYDVDKRAVSHISSGEGDYEVFPWWSPDGKRLYYCSAHFQKRDTVASGGGEEMARYREFKYDLYSKPFDIATHRFGATDTLFRASNIGKSATLPRVSPDGRYLLFTMAEYGCFHIWHKDADLYLMRLSDRQVRPLTLANSPDVESYHSWSSTGRWIVFSSRREDSNYTRLYLSHISPDGKETKAFLLPQQRPDFYQEFSKSYNIPELTVEPVRVTPHEFAEVIRQSPLSVTYQPQ